MSYYRDRERSMIGNQLTLNSLQYKYSGMNEGTKVAHPKEARNSRHNTFKLFSNSLFLSSK